MQSKQKKRILIIDDEEHICKLITETLSDGNYDVASFIDPALALEHIASHPIDLVLSDILMGKYSGSDILEATKENHPDAIIIMMTAHPTVQTAISVLRRGAYDFLVKPFKLEILSATVKRGLAHQKVLRDNLSLKGQVEFLKVVHTYFARGEDIDRYLELVLRCCNTELSAIASAVIEVDPDTKEVIRWIHESSDKESTAVVLDEKRLAGFSGSKSSSPVISTEEIQVDNRKLTRILVSQPIMIRRNWHGIINVLTVSRSELIPPGQLDILSILAGSVAAAIANKNLHEDLQTSYLQAIKALVKAIEARDDYTAGHTERVSKLAEALARKIGWDEVLIQNLRVGCILHDIGKIGVPDSILNKAEKLTDNERKQMNNHPMLGYKIIKGIDLFKPSVPFILAHHERYDGSGYPKGLSGKEIPIEGRLLSVVDTFDAIISNRPYRKGAELSVALKELVKNKGIQFDPLLVESFLDLLRSGKPDLDKIYNRKIDLSPLHNDQKQPIVEKVPV